MYESWGLTEPHTFVSNRHPFDPSLGPGVGYEEALLNNESIGPLAPEDRSALQQVTAKAPSFAGANFKYLPYAVTTEVENCQQIGWIFTF